MSGASIVQDRLRIRLMVTFLKSSTVRAICFSILPGIQS